MKKLVCLLMALVMVLSMTLVASAEGEWKFERKIELVCPWGVGGGADGTLRPLAPLLKDILGVEVEIVNVTGGSGATGIEYAYKQPADGYTFVLGTQSIIMLDLQGTLSMDYKNEFVPVARLVHSINIIAASKVAMDQKGLHNFSELKDYLEKNPYGISVGMLTATGADAAALKQTIKDLSVMEIPYGGGSEMNSALMGGHIDLMITGTDEISGLIASGDILPFLALSENRMSIYPDMECSGELGIDSYIGTWRGLMAKKGTPQEAIDALNAALTQAVETESWKTFLHNAAYDERPGFATGDEFQSFIDDEYKTFIEYLREEGTLVKEY